MKELIIVDKNVFEVECFQRAGVGLAQRYLTSKGEERTRTILLAWHWFWNHLAGPAFLLRKLNWDIKHPIRFNQVFRKWLEKTSEYGLHIVTTYKTEMEWKRKNRDWKQSG